MSDLFVRGSDTSEAAAVSVEPSAKWMRERVLMAIRTAADGMTCDEVESLLVLKHQTASARVRELALSGAIKDSGVRRKTRSGRAAVVWTAQPSGPRGLDTP